MAWHTEGAKAVGTHYLVTIALPSGGRICGCGLWGAKGWAVLHPCTRPDSRIVAFAPLPLAYDGAKKMDESIQFENANERYFVGSDGIACMVTKEFFTSFHISSGEFYKTCGAPWSDEAEYCRIMLELINCSVEIAFREWCGR